MKTQIKANGQAQLFKSPLLEFFTKTSLLESTISSAAISALCIWAGYRLGAQQTATGVACWFFGGMAAWSFFEYVLHRYLFHIANSAFRGSKRLQYLIHGVHHEYPNDAQRTLMPTLPKALLALPFFGAFWLVLGNPGAFFASGFMMGYYFYSLVHYSIHRFRAPGFLRPLWEHHHIHHHLRDDRAFGVSTMLWDRVFGTMPPVKKGEKTAQATEKD